MGSHLCGSEILLSRGDRPPSEPPDVYPEAESLLVTANARSDMELSKSAPLTINSGVCLTTPNIG